ncbi:MAG: bacteriohemerythrin [Rhodospirillales bacterium]
MPIHWSNEYATGNSLIDFDHKMLINLINDLEARVTNRAKPEEISHVISQLATYVDKHFAREEGIFMPTDYPDKESHLAKHQDITATVTDIVELYKRDPKQVQLDKVLDFLMKWLNSHILKTDMAYTPFIKKTDKSAAE